MQDSLPRRKPQFDPNTAIYTPSQAASYGLNAIRTAAEDAKQGLGIEIPIDELSDYCPPLLPGQVMAIIAQTSNYKSSFMRFIENKAAEKLTKLGLDDHIIIHVSVEESIEEQIISELARESGYSVDDIARGAVQDWSKLEQASYRVGTIPIYRIGDSLARAEDMPVLYISNMIKAIKALVEGDILDWKPKVAGIFFDYLQAFPIDPEFKRSGIDHQRRLQVRSDIYRLRMCAAYFRCPVFVAVQAKQHLDGCKPPIMLPGIYDGEESSSIAQRCDRILTIWMPKMTHYIGERITDGKWDFVVSENMLFIKVAKQRGRLPSGKIFPCKIDFAKNEIRLDELLMKPLGSPLKHSAARNSSEEFDRMFGDDD